MKMVVPIKDERKKTTVDKRQQQFYEIERTTKVVAPLGEELGDLRFKR